MKTFGSRAEVLHGNAMKTSGGLTKKNLRRNKHGRIVSIRASKSAKKNKNLGANQAKKGDPFGPATKTEKKSKRKSKGKKRR
jgi:hypothetical protein